MYQELKTNIKMELNGFNFKNSQLAWEFFNEYFFLASEGILEEDGGNRNGAELELFNVFISIKKPKVKETLDFGNYFGYRSQKWVNLVNNYINIIELDRVKEEISLKELKKAKSYNISMKCSNHHGHGKGCLLTMTFSRRQNNDRPIITLHTRATEVTKRMLMDFLLIQRIGEYIYGNNKFSIAMFTIKMYQNAEAFSMYNNHVPIKTLIGDGHNDPWQERCLNVLNKFLTCNIEDVKYKVHKRSVRQLQRDKNGHPLSGDHPMLAKDLLFLPHESNLENYSKNQLKAFDKRKAKMLELTNTIK